LELKNRNGRKSTLKEIEQLYTYGDFNGFLMAFKAVSEELAGPAEYELITYRLMEKLKAENILHAEVTIAAGVCLLRKQNVDLIFEGLGGGRERGERDFGVSLLWIMDAVRQFGAADARRVAELAARYRDRHVAGFGIGGDERQAPPELFREVYAYA